MKAETAIQVLDALSKKEQKRFFKMCGIHKAKLKGNDWHKNHFKNQILKINYGRSN